MGTLQISITNLQPIICFNSADCGPLPDFVQVIEIAVPDTRSGSIGTFYCRPGFAFEGGNLTIEITCGELGVWDNAPTDEPTRKSPYCYYMNSRCNAYVCKQFWLNLDISNYKSTAYCWCAWLLTDLLSFLINQKKNRIDIQKG